MNISWKNLKNSTTSPLFQLFILFLCAIILFYRVPDRFLNPQFWAEDGVIFFSQNMTLGVAALWKPYAGYLHAIPRSIAYLGTFFPISFVPTLYNQWFGQFMKA